MKVRLNLRVPEGTAEVRMAKNLKKNKHKVNIFLFTHAAFHSQNPTEIQIHSRINTYY